MATHSLASFTSLAWLANRVHRGDMDLEGALDLAPYPAQAAEEPLARAMAQLRGELDR